MNRLTKDLASTAAAATAALALTVGGVAPATAAPTPAPVAATSATPLLGMGAGAYAWWCGFYGIGCKYKTFYDRTGTYRLRCANIGCTRFF